MKIRKLLITSLVLLLTFTTVSNVSAYSTANKKNKSTISMENIKWSQNLVPISKLANATSCFNGTMSVSNNKAIMYLTLNHDSTKHVMYYEPYALDWRNYGFSADQERTMNKNAVERLGSEIQPNGKIRVSYSSSVTGTGSFDYSSPVMFFCDENYNFISFTTKYNSANGVVEYYDVPSNAKYMSIRIDPYWYRGTAVGNETFTISNLEVKQVLN